MQSIVDAAKVNQPSIIGFSIIFQVFTSDFAELGARLRLAGVVSHITVGGHFPSFCPRETLEIIPAADSVVRFEGEYTLLEMMRNLWNPAKWKNIPGLAYRNGTKIEVTPVRPLIDNLDVLPFPKRDEARELTRGIQAASLLASRGCFNDCVFCSIRQFYGIPAGPLHRTRSADSVVNEMEDLYKKGGVRFFLFQDDDFLFRSTAQRAWIVRFLHELDVRGLSDKIAWKISCRVDDVDREAMRECGKRGLASVYLGVESGNSDGLRTLNKNTTVEQNIAAIETLKLLDINYEFGFMLLDPGSTKGSVFANLSFLEKITSDGSSPIAFNKMLPFVGTPIYDQLRSEKRLEGSLQAPNYRFFDTRLDWFDLFLSLTFGHHNFEQDGLVNRLRQARLDLIIMKRFFGDSRSDEYRASLWGLSSNINQYTLRTLREALDVCFEGDEDTIPSRWHKIDAVRDRFYSEEQNSAKQLDEILCRYSGPGFA